MKVTAIVPVYNAEDTLRRCADSVLRQGWDLILVNAGSTDNSDIICNEYRDRARVVHSSNWGPSIARNIGMNLAKDSDYITFVDSDDYIEGEDVPTWSSDLSAYTHRYLTKPYASSTHAWSVWGKLFAADTIVRFHPCSRILEDVDFLYRYMKVHKHVLLYHGYSHTKPTADRPHASMAGHQEQQEMIGRAMSSVHRYTGESVGHTYTCLSILHLIRGCRKLGWDTFWYVCAVVCAFNRDYLKEYRRAKGHSVLIPILIKRRFVFLTMLACWWRARRRYAT